MTEIVTNEPVLDFGKKHKRKIILISIAGLLLCGTGVYAYESIMSTTNAAPMMQIATVKRGDVTETVSASGKAQAPKQVSLSFSSGDEAISSLSVKIGDQVKAGQVLASLDDSILKVEVSNAQANVSAAKAKLTEALQGSTSEELAILQANVKKAKASLDIAFNKFDEQKAFISQEKSKVALQIAKDNYNTQKYLFDSGSIPKSQLDQVKNDVDQAQSDYHTAVLQYGQSQAQAKNTIEQSQASYDIAVAQLKQATLPPLASTIQTAKAAVEQAEAQLQQKQNELDKMTIKAPIDGVILQVNGDVGGPATNPFIVMDNSNSGNLHVMTQISQSDIGKMKVGMNASITSSSYDDKPIKGKVSMIYPEATTESGVTTYNVLISVDHNEALLKPGMTTSVTIEIGTHKNALYVPSAALRDQNGKMGVMVTSNQSSAKSQESSKNRFVPVTVGYYSANRVEILSGLKEGDQIVIAYQNVATSSSANGRSNGMSGIPGMGGAGGSLGGTRGVR